MECITIFVPISVFHAMAVVGNSNDENNQVVPILSRLKCSISFFYLMQHHSSFTFGHEGGLLFQAPSSAPFLRVAESLHHWWTNHHLALQQFSHFIVSDIRQCLSINKDNILGIFYELRTSSHFHMKWQVFVSASVGNFAPTFQYVTDSLLIRYFEESSSSSTYYIVNFITS